MCRLESIRDILNIIFRDGGKSHAKYYRVSHLFFLHASLVCKSEFALIPKCCYSKFHVQESLPSISDSSKGSET